MLLSKNKNIFLNLIFLNRNAKFKKFYNVTKNTSKVIKNILIKISFKLLFHHFQIFTIAKSAGKNGKKKIKYD